MNKVYLIVFKKIYVLCRYNDRNLFYMTYSYRHSFNAHTHTRDFKLYMNAQ